jgi:hypothetical protein
MHECALEDPIAITQRGLFSLTPEVWAKVTEVTVKKHISHQPVLKGLMLDVLPDTLDSLSLADTFFVGGARACRF